MKVRPLYDNIIVKRLEAETTTMSGIIIPDNAKEKPSEGIVQAVGNGKVSDKGETRPLQVKEGDRVLFGKYSGSEIKINGEELLILSEDKILAIIEA
jgi:chaperonin GroES